LNILVETKGMEPRAQGTETNSNRAQHAPGKEIKRREEQSSIRDYCLNAVHNSDMNDKKKPTNWNHRKIFIKWTRRNHYWTEGPITNGAVKSTHVKIICLENECIRHRRCSP